MLLPLTSFAKIATAIRYDAQRHLVEGEQCPAGNAEILAAGFAAPARRTVRPAAGIDGQAAAVRAVGVAVVVRPTEPDEHPLGLLIRHARDGR